MTIKYNVIKYINEHQLSKERISIDTKVDREKFNKNSRKNFTAEEFLRICAYLEVEPEIFYKKKL